MILIINVKNICYWGCWDRTSAQVDQSRGTNPASWQCWEALTQALIPWTPGSSNKQGLGKIAKHSSSITQRDQALQRKTANWGDKPRRTVSHQQLWLEWGKVSHAPWTNPSWSVRGSPAPPHCLSPALCLFWNFLSKTLTQEHSEQKLVRQEPFTPLRAFPTANKVSPAFNQHPNHFSLSSGNTWINRCA